MFFTTSSIPIRVLQKIDNLKKKFAILQTSSLLGYIFNAMKN